MTSQLGVNQGAKLLPRNAFTGCAEIARCTAMSNRPKGACNCGHPEIQQISFVGASDNADG